MVFIPFERADIDVDPQRIDDTSLLRALDDAGDAVPLFVSLGKHFQETDRGEIDKKVSDMLTEKDIVINMRVRRTYTILLSFALKVVIATLHNYVMCRSYPFQLADLTAVGPSHEEIWDYFLAKIIPVVAHWQIEKTAKTSTDLTYSIGPSGVAATITPLISGILDQLESSDANLNQV